MAAFLAAAAGCNKGTSEPVAEAPQGNESAPATEAPANEAPEASSPPVDPSPEDQGPLLWTSRTAAEPPAGNGQPTDELEGELDASSEPNPPAPPAWARDSLELPPVEGYQELANFLVEADRELQRLGTVEPSAAERERLAEELGRVARLKQEAAERMLAAPALEDDQKTTAIRARMQALSHQAALGNLAAANELEAYAVEMLNHPENDIARDSRTTLVGFALERLQGGITQQPEEVLRFTGELASQPELLDASAIKAMEQSWVVLQRYGYDDAANTVRGYLETAASEVNNAALREMIDQALAAHAP